MRLVMDCLKTLDGIRSTTGWGGMTTSNASRLALLLLLCGCPATSGEVGDLPGDSGTGGESMGSTSGTADPESDTAEGSTANETDDDSASETGAPPAADCTDLDADGVPLAEDNAPTYPNPQQLDSDDDGIADVIDLCPLVGGDATNTADSDKDGIGNACDLCGRPVSEYQVSDAIPDYMRVRTLPLVGDFDGDGVGDACDNCPTVPNCYGYGDGETFTGEVPEIDGVDCQADADADGIGDACDPDLGGTASFEEEGDFDDDGIPNSLDYCPRAPLPESLRSACDGPGDCPGGGTCTTSGVCNHYDGDGDAVGDICDSCVYVPNPGQAAEGSLDDFDGDAVGDICEAGPECANRANPAKIGRHPVAVEGACCTVELVADASGDLYRAAGCTDPDAAPDACMPLIAPDRSNPGAHIPVRIRDACDESQENNFECVALPTEVEGTPGVLTLPTGCTEALDTAGLSAVENLMVEPGSLETPWDATCRRPQFDIDFDGLGDVCDLCYYGFDPSNQAYVDEDGRLWPDDGEVCNGDFLCRP